MTNLVIRLLSAAVAIPLILGVIFYWPVKGVLFMVLLFAALGCYEVGRFAMPDASPVRRFSLPILGLLAASGVYLAPARPFVGLAVLAITVILSILLNLFVQTDFAKSVNQSAVSLLAAFWVGGLLAFVALLTARPNGSGWGVLFMGMTFVGDSAAYFVGRTLGRHKLAPAISPKKTWEGAIGGVFFVVVWVLACKIFFVPELKYGDIVPLGVVGSVLAQAGDLAESLLKRAYDVKDASGLIPGHGGVMDRLDSMLFLAPWIYFYASLG